MEKKKWTNLPDFLVLGIEVIDEQHDGFVALLNELKGTEICSENRDNLKDLIRRLKVYSQHHFKEEEKLMKECGYPGILEHQEHHQVFRENLTELEKGLSYKNLMIDVQLKSFLTRWALSHIGEHDLKFGEYFTSRS